MTYCHKCNTDARICHSLPSIKDCPIFMLNNPEYGKKTYVRPPEVFTAYGTPKSILEVGIGECRFIVEGIELCCGAKCEQVYCKKHMKICYRAEEK